MRPSPEYPIATITTGRRCLLVALALVVLLPARASASMDCGIHGLRGMVEASTTAQGHSRWESIPPVSDECPHCVPKHCAAAPACGASLASILPTPVRAAMALPFSPRIPAPDTQLSPCLDSPPPTPPPQISV